MTDHTFLMVPMRLDALSVTERAQIAVRRSPDFTRLPFFDNNRRIDINADTAFLSETIVPQPFANADVEMGVGLHLHWAMPDALTTGVYDPDPDVDAIVFPELPTRWVVARRKREGAKRTVEHRWIVESDYLAPAGVNRRGLAIDIPHGDRSSGQPFRHLGRWMPLDGWSIDDEVDRLESLTAAGFGDPSFAAYYPSCFSVFGFRDPDPPDDLRTVDYQVIGWYPDSDGADKPRDPLRQLSASDGFDIAMIEEHFDWKPAEGAAGPLPSRILCHATIEFAPAPSGTDDGRTAPISVTVANTPGEALAAKLASVVVGDHTASTADPMAARAIVETQLEALEVSTRLDENSLNLRTQIEALQHQTRFSPVEVGTTWRIRTEDVSPGAGETAAGEEPSPSTRPQPFPAAVIDALAALNSTQRQYDINTSIIGDLQRRTFADWYKYMISLYPPDAGSRRYPDPDLIRFFIERGDLATLTGLIATTGRLEFDLTGQAPSVDPDDTDSLAARVVADTSLLAKAIADFRSTLSTAEQAKYAHTIETIPGGRFWQPTNPVVLLSGDGVRPTDRHGQDGTLTCAVHTGSMATGAGIVQAADAVAANDDPSDHGHNLWMVQPWNPVVLEWKVQLFSLADRAERFLGSERYSRAYISSNYEAPIHSPELQLKRGRGALVPDPSVYVGSTILTGHASTQLGNAIAERLVRRSTEVQGYLAEHEVIDGQARLATLHDPATIDAILASLADRSLANPVYTLLRSLREIAVTPSMSQELGGFNEALIQHKDTIELTIDDPVNFESYRAYSRDGVRGALVGGTRIAPSPHHAFNPIRAGSLKIVELKVVDTFGRSRQVDIDDLTTATAMATPGAEHLVELAPRLSQPARLDFRWLAAGSNSSSVASTEQDAPICGWLLPNLLDRSLAIHDGAGRSLGSFKTGDANGTWRLPPGGSPAPTTDAIANPHLRRVVEFVQHGIEVEGSDFVGTLMGVIDDALDNIGGTDLRGAQGSAALVGRPLAVVRAAFDLKLMGAPAVNHSWDVFTRDLGRTTRTTSDFTKVQFPVRIGEYGEHGDGLVGYWLEQRDAEGKISFVDEHGSDTARFYAPQSDYIDTATIETQFEALGDGAINFHQCVDDPPQTLTMLVDPRFSVHATVGILPRKSVDIPQEQYAEALDAIEIDFLHAPLLTPTGRVEIPLRPIPGFDWTWIEQRENRWVELHPRKRIEQSQLVEAWDLARAAGTAPDAGDGQALWSAVTDPLVAWVRPLTPVSAGAAENPEYLVVPHEDSARAATLPPPFAGREQRVTEMLDRAGVGVDPIDTQARFGLTNEIRDGWMKLRRSTAIGTE